MDKEVINQLKNINVKLDELISINKKEAPIQISSVPVAKIDIINKCINDESCLAEQIRLAALSNSALQHHVDVYDRHCYSKTHTKNRIEDLWTLAEGRNKYKRNPHVLQHFRGLLGEDVNVELMNTVYSFLKIPLEISIDETIRKDTDHGEDFRFGAYIIDTKYRHHKGRELAIKDKLHISADILLFVEGECEIDLCICEKKDAARTTTLKGYIFKNDFCKHSNKKLLRSDQAPKWVLPAYRLQDMNFLVRIALAEYIKSL